MKYLLMLSLLIVAVMAKAQNCTYEVFKENKFDNEVEKLTEAIVIAQKVQRDNALPLRKVMAQLRQLDVQHYFVLKFPVTMVMSPTFSDSKKDSELVLLLENKEKIVLPLADLMRNVEDKVEFRYATDFVLMADDIALLKKQKITDIRVGMKNNTFDIVLEKDAAELLRRSFDCLD